MRGTASFDRLEAVGEAKESTAEYAKYAEKEPEAPLSELKLGFHGRETKQWLKLHANKVRVVSAYSAYSAV